MTNYSSVTDPDHFVLPMYVGKYYTEKFDMTTKAGRKSAYSTSNVPEQCYTKWEKPFTEPYPPYAEGTRGYISWQYSNAAVTRFITYSKWLFDEFDDDKQDLPRNPPFIEISGKYRYFNFANLYLSPLTDMSNVAVLLKVTDIGRGWYRYEWGETGNMPYIRTQSIPSTISHTFTQDPV